MGNCLISGILNTIRHIVNQATPNKDKNYLVNLWSFMVLLLSGSFSGGTLSAFINQNSHSIQSLDELFEKNETIIISNQSFVWWEFNHKIKYKKVLDSHLDRLYTTQRIEYLDVNGMSEMEQKV